MQHTTTDHYSSTSTSKCHKHVPGVLFFFFFLPFCFVDIVFFVCCCDALSLLSMSYDERQLGTYFCVQNGIGPVCAGRRRNGFKRCANFARGWFPVAETIAKLYRSDDLGTSRSPALLAKENIVLYVRREKAFARTGHVVPFFFYFTYVHTFFFPVSAFRFGAQLFGGGFH